jgi:peroxiredoxin
MALMETPVCEFGLAAPDFSLPDYDGRIWSLEECRGKNGTLVMFICNHCPYVKSIHAKLVRDTTELLSLGINSVAIMANDYREYPEDAPARLKEMAEKWDYPFPYLIDEKQSVARAYGAICTPDFFGYNADLGLQYRGRLDKAGRNSDADDAPRDLFEAMACVAKTGHGPVEQIPSMGCSIKWLSNQPHDN